MPYFHATHRNRLPSIMKFGLCTGHGQNFDCLPAVYRATDPVIALGFMLDHYLEFGETGRKPSDVIEDWIVIVIDDSLVSGELMIDPQFEHEGHAWIYDGVIDIRGMPVLAADLIFADNQPGKRE